MPHDSSPPTPAHRHEPIDSPDDSAADAQVQRQNLGKALRQERKRGKRSLREFADAVVEHLRESGISVAFNHVALWRIEEGQVRNPNLAVIKACDVIARSGTRLQTLAQKFTHSAELDSRPHIPPITDCFVGRRDAWQHLDALYPILTFTGPPGIGKTQTLLQWYHANAARLAAQFPGGVAWVDLHGYDREVRPIHPDAALETILQQFNPGSAIPTPGAKRAQMYYQYCERASVLVLLDNAANAEQALPLIPPSRHCSVVITSRHHLGKVHTERGGRHVILTPLTPDESHQLLRSRVGNRISAEPAAAADVADYCGHLPLALVLAAEYLKSHPQHTVGALAHRLAADDGHRLDLLAADDKHIRSAFLLSYRVLSPTTRQVFRLLGLHPSPAIATDTASAITERPVDEVEQHMEALADAHLLERSDPDRYRFHDLLQHFAAERARHEDPPALRSAVTERIQHYYLHTAAAATATAVPHVRLPVAVATPQTLFTSHYDATQWLVAERANLHAVARQASRRGDTTLAWHFAVVQGPEVTAGPRTPWHNAQLLGMRAARDSGDLLGVAWCAFHLGLHHTQLREWQDADKYLAQALEHWRRIGHEYGEAWTLWAQAHLAADQGQPHQALHLYQSLLHSGVEDNHLHAAIHASMGAAYCSLPTPNPEAAVESLSQALAHFAEESVPASEAVTLLRLSDAWRLLGNRGKALRLLDRAYSCYVTLGATTGLAEVMLRQAHIHLEVGAVGRARRVATSAWQMFADADDPRVADADDLLATLANTAS